MKVVAPTLTAPGLNKGFSGICAGKPSASELVAGGKAPYAYSITQGNCSAEARTAATASTVFVIKNNNTQIGTITFGAGSATGTFSISTPAVAENNFMEVRAPASPDSTLADIAFLVRE